MRYSITSMLVYIVNFIFGLAALGLLLRFLFRLFGANTESPFVAFLYNSTNPLLSPFRGIFEPYVADGRFVFEFSTLIAIAIYLLLAWLIIEFIKYIDDVSAKRTL